MVHGGKLARKGDDATVSTPLAARACRRSSTEVSLGAGPGPTTLSGSGVERHGNSGDAPAARIGNGPLDERAMTDVDAVERADSDDRIAEVDGSIPVQTDNGGTRRCDKKIALKFLAQGHHKATPPIACGNTSHMAMRPASRRATACSDPSCTSATMSPSPTGRVRGRYELRRQAPAAANVLERLRGHQDGGAAQHAHGIKAAALRGIHRERIDVQTVGKASPYPKRYGAATPHAPRNPRSGPGRARGRGCRFPCSRCRQPSTQVSPRRRSPQRGSRRAPRRSAAAARRHRPRGRAYRSARPFTEMAENAGGYLHLGADARRDRTLGECTVEKLGHHLDATGRLPFRVIGIRLEAERDVGDIRFGFLRDTAKVAVSPGRRRAPSRPRPAGQACPHGPTRALGQRAARPRERRRARCSRPACRRRTAGVLNWVCDAPCPPRYSSTWMPSASTPTSSQSMAAHRSASRRCCPRR